MKNTIWLACLPAGGRAGAETRPNIVCIILIGLYSLQIFAATNEPLRSRPTGVAAEKSAAPAKRTPPVTRISELA